MGTSLKQVAAIALVVPVMGACVHPGQYKKDLADTRAQIAQEKSDRMAADSSLKGEIESVKSDVTSLRSDLQNLRTEYGAKISALESGMQFAFPVNFAFDDATVRDQDKAELDKFADVAKKYYGGSKITIEGFADPAGSQHYNLALSQRRADAVRDYLSTKGIDLSVIKTVGYGKTRLVNPGAQRDDAGAEENRRVVFVIETKGQATPETKTTASIN
jgi:outer membrane protein OmpA-like peptidoglycan-associated protein